MTDYNAIEAQIRETKQAYVHDVLDIIGREDVKMKDLAEACGFSKQHLSIALYHNENSTLHTLCRIAFGLGYRARIVLEPIREEKKDA